MKVWTKGLKKSLVKFIAPAKDRGNASLTLDEQMWSYNPKVNRIIKIPSSMKTQSWMGSDFSYNDLSKADDIIEQYTHRVIGRDKSEGMEVLVIESIPLESAPIVWGKEILLVRSDNIIVKHTFYDQKMEPVKEMRALEIVPMGGKTFAKTMRMTNLEEKDDWTELVHHKVEFGKELSDVIFNKGI